ncbi:hypothetical protein HKX48_006888 [Thoreauomyces humboldtii]|nr:hypothetical protein HKX48_006888 [Thoreauomyces humboldtii]
MQVEMLSVPPPFVYYQSHNHLSRPGPAVATPLSAPASEPEESLSLEAATQPPAASADILSLFPIARLYYCQDCSRICCPVCVTEEIAFYYCPNCLFEVPTASVKAERNRCGRNCFECPVCENTLSVVSTVEPPATATTPTTPDAAASPTTTSNVHYLACGACRWDSLEIGLQFERPTGLASQLQPTEDARPDVQEFEHLRQHFEKLLKSKDTANNVNPMGLLRGLSGGGLNLPSSLLATMPGLASFASIGRRSTTRESAAARAGREVKVETYTSSIELGNDKGEAAKDLIPSDIIPGTTLKQRLRQPNDNPVEVAHLRPHRVQLRTKRSKRCRRCDHMVVKPEHKAHSTRFTIKMLAIHAIPTITICHPFPETLQWDAPCTIILRFTNPLEVGITIALATTNAVVEPREDEPQAEPGNCQVTLLAPTFTVDPVREIWDYEDEPSASPLNVGVGVHERTKNTTSVSVQVTPRRRDSDEALNEGHTIQFSLLVHVSPIEEVDAGHLTLSSEAASAPAPAPVAKRTVPPVAFWVAVGLGAVERERAGQ